MMPLFGMLAIMFAHGGGGKGPPDRKWSFALAAWAFIAAGLYAGLVGRYRPPFGVGTEPLAGTIRVLLGCFTIGLVLVFGAFKGYQLLKVINFMLLLAIVGCLLGHAIAKRLK